MLFGGTEFFSLPKNRVWCGIHGNNLWKIWLPSLDIKTPEPHVAVKSYPKVGPRFWLNMHQLTLINTLMNLIFCDFFGHNSVLSSPTWRMEQLPVTCHFRWSYTPRFVFSIASHIQQRWVLYYTVCNAFFTVFLVL